MKAIAVYLIMSRDKKNYYYAKLYDDAFGCRLFISSHFYNYIGSHWINRVVKNNIVNYIDTDDKKLSNKKYIADNSYNSYATNVRKKYRDIPLTELVYNADFLSSLLYIEDVVIIDLLPNRFMTTKKAI